MAKKTNITDETRAKQQAATANRKRVQSGKNKGEFAPEAPKGKKGINKGVARFESLVPRDRDISLEEFNNDAAKKLAQANKIKSLTQVPTLSIEEKTQATELVIDRVRAVASVVLLEKFETLMKTPEGQAELVDFYGAIDWNQ